MSASFSILRLKAKRTSKQRSFGFTLIELLAVVAIFAIIASMVVLNIGSDPHRIMESTAKRFVGQLGLISEEAAMRGVEFGLLLDEEQGTYQFLVYDEYKWIPAPIPQYARPVKLSESLNATIDLEDDLAVNYLEGGNTLLDEDFSSDDKEELLPQVAILSSGELTPFLLTLESTDETETLKIKINRQGQYELERENDFS